MNGVPMLLLSVGSIIAVLFFVTYRSPNYLCPGAAGDTSSILKESRGVKNLILADGPAGLRLQNHFRLMKDGRIITDKKDLFQKALDGTDYYQYCTAIPIGWNVAMSWNLSLIELAGDIIGEEMETFGVDIWLAPALNIHRNPLCGRNFEYYSEDPFVAGKVTAAITRGVQKHKGKAVCIKHFAVNNQEENRYFVNAHVSERALREIYLGYFTYPDIEYLPHSDLNTLFISTDKLTLGYYELSPGAQFDPPDHHPGDECYYILEGELTETNCNSGQACRLLPDDALLIPHSAAHGGHNFGTKKMKAVFALAPNMVKPGDQTFPTDLEGKIRVLKGEQEEQYVKYPPKEQKRILGSIDRLGNWPVPDEELREEPKYLRVAREEDKLCIVNGVENPYLMKFSFSTKYMNFGEIILPQGSNRCRISDPERHKGQTALYVRSGYLCVIITDTRETS